MDRGTGSSLCLFEDDSPSHGGPAQNLDLGSAETPGSPYRAGVSHGARTSLSLRRHALRILENSPASEKETYPAARPSFSISAASTISGFMGSFRRRIPTAS